MNCQLYSGWRQGKRKPGIRSCGVGLVEAAGESIEVGGVGTGWGVGVSDGEGYGAPVIDFSKESFGEEAVGVREVEAAMSGKVALMRAARGCGAGVSLMA